MPQIDPRMISNQLQSSVFLYTCQSADVMEIIKKSPSENGRCPYDHHFIRASFFQCVALKERALDPGEGINRRIKSLKRSCFGFRNLDNFRKRRRC